MRAAGGFLALSPIWRMVAGARSQRLKSVFRSALCEFVRALGQLHQIEMAQVKGQFFGGGIASIGDRLEAPQDDLLKCRSRSPDEGLVAG